MAFQFLGDDDYEEASSQNSSPSNKNLVDRVIYNAKNLAPIDGAFDKFNVKKRWWTPEED